jgi:WD40 repeat protein
VKLWDTTTGQEVFTLTGHGRQVTGVAFSPDGRRLASCSYGSGRYDEVRVWDTTPTDEGPRK